MSVFPTSALTQHVQQWHMSEENLHANLTQLSISTSNARAQLQGLRQTLRRVSVILQTLSNPPSDAAQDMLTNLSMVS